MTSRLAARLFLAAAVATLTACGGTAATSSSTGSNPAEGVVRVGLTEWVIVTSSRAVEPGSVELQVTNTGGTEHDLIITGASGHWATPMLDPGDEAELTIEATAGEELELTCSVPGHEPQGMRSTLQVAEPKG
jgi:hypothetical protein